MCKLGNKQKNISLNCATSGNYIVIIRTNELKKSKRNSILIICICFSKRCIRGEFGGLCVGGREGYGEN